MELTRENELIFFREQVNKQLTRVLSLSDLRETDHWPKNENTILKEQTPVSRPILCKKMFFFGEGGGGVGRGVFWAM